MSSIKYTVAALGLLCIAAALTLAHHVVHGGFYSDDWGNAADFHFVHSPRILSLAQLIYAGQGARYLLVLAIPIPHALFGLDMSWHVALAAGIGVATSLCFYLLLVSVGVTWVHAAALSTLSLLFPWSDSIKLWPVAAINSIAVCLYFLGSAVAVRGLRHQGRRGRAMHLGAILLYLLSIFTYEVALPCILLSIALYASAAPDRTVAWRRWRADAVFGSLALVSVILLSKRQAPSAYGLASDLVHFPAGGISLLGHAMLPVGLPNLAAAATAIVVVCLVGHLSRAGSSRTPEMRRWVACGARAALLTAAGELLFLGSGLRPLSSGTENRGNLLVGYGYVTVAYALLRVVALLVTRDNRRLGSILPATVAIALMGGYGLQLERDASRWDRAIAEQKQILRHVSATVPALPPGTTLYVFSAPGRMAPGVPIFAEPWDLRGAVRLLYRDTYLAAFPVYGATKIICGRRSLYPEWHGDVQGPDGGYGAGDGALYGHAIFVDGNLRRSLVVLSQASCKAAVQEFRPGPLFAHAA